MSVLDVDTLLAPVSPEAPCGENLEYDADYAAMEKAAAGKPEQQFGDTKIPGEEPNWKEVRTKALDLLSRTKDLRIGSYLARAATWTDGLPGLADGMQVLQGLVETYWPTVHPQLDPEDNNDPTLRLNTIASLCDPSTMLRGVQFAPLASPRPGVRFSYRDVQVAAGELPQPAGAEKLEQSVIDGAFNECNGADLIATTRAVKKALAGAKQLEEELVKQVGVGGVTPLDPLTDLLGTIAKLLSQKLASRGLSDEERPEAPEAEPVSSAVMAENADGDGQAATAGANGRKSGAPMILTGDISSREDVIRALDKICDYYKRYEPSSPVPLFLNRAKRLASKSFLEILRDLTPDAVNQALAISGITDGAAAGAGVVENDI